MNYNLKGCVLALGLACASVSPFVVSAATTATLTANDVEQFREELQGFFSDVLYEAAQVDGTDHLLPQLEAAQAQLATMAGPELREMYAQMEANPEMWQLPEYIRQSTEVHNKIEQYKEQYDSRNRSYNGGTMSDGTGFESAETYEQYDDSIHCVDFLNFVEGVPFSVFTLVQEVHAGLASLSADALANTLSPSIVTVAAGNGGGVPNPLKATAVLAAQVTKAYWQGIKWYRQTVAECKGKLHRKYLYEVVGLQQADHTPKKEVHLITEYVDRKLKQRVHEYYFIVHAKLDGQPIDVSFVSAKMSDKSIPVTFVEHEDKRDVTLRKLGEGLFELKLSYDNPGFFHPRKMQLIMQHTRNSAKYGQTVTHKGISFTDVMP